MQLYVVLKTVHVLAAMVFLGTGFGSAWYRIRADASEDIDVIVWCQREIVRADWYFTVPSAVALPLTAIGMVHLAGLSWTTLWIMWGVMGYVLAGLLWLPAAWLQIAMRRMAEEARASGTPLPDDYRLAARVWTALGIPSFLAAIVTVWLMVSKHTAGG